MINDGLAELRRQAQRPLHRLRRACRCRTATAAAAERLSAPFGSLASKALQILTNVAGKELSIPSLPVLGESRGAGALVVDPPNGFTEGQRLTRFYFNNVVGNPFDTTRWPCTT